MTIKPVGSVFSVEDVFPNRFDLALAASCRARMLAQGHSPKIKTKSKPTVTALEEIAQGKVGREVLKRIRG